MSNLHERMQRDERMKRRWAVLRNQVELLRAVELLSHVSVGDTALFQRMTAMEQKLSREILLSTEAIWDESAKDGEEAVNV